VEVVDQDLPAFHLEVVVDHHQVQALAPAVLQEVVVVNN